ncbi:hypothetical protein C7T35_04270 [Variovorax sp. WS11]|uniref:type III secretion system chaperone n=1 Tax=Variovorax sp. WS11 TaxID=1105204 RepID=UPI000D0CC121|nr:type III secretion system chaperone [Variovorax sp. WS11]NDZ16588.1 hypothetical protein [Variovorax sp. WS11]PSL85842.1 hypothetical protein C7T35_04270 [Variovorax sp. WS11]
MQISGRLQWRAAFFNGLVEQHCTAGNLPLPQVQPHGGYAFSDGGICAVHAICRGQFLELTTSAGRIPLTQMPARPPTSESWSLPLLNSGLLRPAEEGAPPSIGVTHGVAGFERSEIDLETRQLILRHWLAMEELDQPTFSRAVEGMRERAVLWNSLFELENT